MALCIQMRVPGYTVAPWTRSSHTADPPNKRLCDPLLILPDRGLHENPWGKVCSGLNTRKAMKLLSRACLNGR